jgi:N-acetyl-gamma-glutamyl-phosphate reductase
LSNAFRASDEAVYSVPELHRQQVPGATLIANPGCYPTASLLAIRPLIDAGLVGSGPILIDAKSGPTGAGRKLDDAMTFNELGENHYPYRVGSHQHVPEIERYLGREIVFTPHLLPTRRGLLVTAYFRVADGVRAAALRACLESKYGSEPLVQVVEPGPSIGIGVVAHKPIARVAVAPIIKAGFARVFGSIDNLMKGAASQAVQNLNLAMGLPETQGLIP